MRRRSTLQTIQGPIPNSWVIYQVFVHALSHCSSLMLLIILFLYLIDDTTQNKDTIYGRECLPKTSLIRGCLPLSRIQSSWVIPASKHGIIPDHALYARGKPDAISKVHRCLALPHQIRHHISSPPVIPYIAVMNFTIVKSTKDSLPIIKLSHALRSMSWIFRKPATCWVLILNHKNLTTLRLWEYL